MHHILHSHLFDNGNLFRSEDGPYVGVPICFVLDGETLPQGIPTDTPDDHAKTCLERFLGFNVLIYRTRHCQ